jgi:hypothetical protein
LVPWYCKDMETTTETKGSDMTTMTVHELVESGTISIDLGSAMLETKRICAERCPTCDVGIGKWCEHRLFNAYGTKRSVLGEIGR